MTPSTWLEKGRTIRRQAATGGRCDVGGSDGQEEVGERWNGEGKRWMAEGKKWQAEVKR